VELILYYAPNACSLVPYVTLWFRKSLLRLFRMCKAPTQDSPSLPARGRKMGSGVAAMSTVPAVAQ